MSEVLNGKNGSNENDIRQVLIDVGEAFLDTHSRSHEIMRMYIAESRRSPEVGQQYCRRLVAPVEAIMEKYFKRQIERKAFRNVNVKLAAHAFFGMFVNFILTQD